MIDRRYRRSTGKKNPEETKRTRIEKTGENQTAEQ